MTQSDYPIRMTIFYCMQKIKFHEDQTYYQELMLKILDFLILIMIQGEFGLHNQSK